MKLLFTGYLLCLSLFMTAQNSRESYAVRIAPQASIDLSASKGQFDLGTQISFICQDQYTEGTRFLLEGGYTLKTLTYGDSKNGSTTRLHGFQITGAFEWGTDWKFGIGPYMNILMGTASSITLNGTKRNLTDTETNQRGLRNVDLGSTIRVSRSVSSKSLIELGIDNTLVNIIETTTSQIFPMTIWVGLRFQL